MTSIVKDIDFKHEKYDDESKEELYKSSVEKIQDVQSELFDLLSQHLEKLKNLQQHRTKIDFTHTKINPSENLFDHPFNIDRSNDAEVQTKSSPVDQLNHIKPLYNFLDSQIDNINVLRNSLAPLLLGAPLTPATSGSPSPPFEIGDPGANQTTVLKKPNSRERKEYEALAEQFNSLVVISTFTAGLIVSFLSLVYGIIATEHRMAFDFGMLLSFLAMGAHLGNIVIAGRGVAVISQQQAIEENVLHDLAYFRHYLAICEQLQFWATILFVASIIVLCFFIFSSVAFPSVLLGISLIASFFVFWKVYWKISITLRNLKFIVGSVRGLRRASPDSMPT
ncbi:hypothetical protein BDQ12DRAFT_720572 [Crucibulum laeve]|uniref:Uncharacterized protein n=1 Tax=Crucibulum laeve TaxID=68775 RepID=A0A5C3MD21_9AGAR|nr:hypothetical protein BDQ12DRAFT_720572 [Crucibulum laeve]